MVGGGGEGDGVHLLTNSRILLLGCFVRIFGSVSTDYMEICRGSCYCIFVPPSFPENKVNIDYDGRDSETKLINFVFSTTSFSLRI